MLDCSSNSSGGFLGRAQIPADAPEEIKAFFRLRFEEGKSLVQIAELSGRSIENMVEVEQEILRRYMTKKAWGAQ